MFSGLRVHFSSSRYEADEDSGFALVGLVLDDVLETTVSVRQVRLTGNVQKCFKRNKDLGFFLIRLHV